MRVTNERLKDIRNDIAGNLARVDKNIGSSPLAPHLEDVRQRYTDLVCCLDELERLREESAPAACEPQYIPAGCSATLRFSSAPVNTAWGDGMVEALIELDKDHTLRLFTDAEAVHLVIPALQRLVEPKK